jgi:hypothetical protein
MAVARLQDKLPGPTEMVEAAAILAMVSLTAVEQVEILKTGQVVVAPAAIQHVAATLTKVETA